ncbi:MAG: hypothetical protein IE927_07845 [Rhodobacterales bacterium]|nr:hypothetical protein [Rhodobacterales bacterium]
MQMFRMEDTRQASPVGWGVQALLLADPADEALAAGVARFGVRLTVEGELYAGLSAIADDPAEWGLLVMDCDRFGGLSTVQHALALLGEEARRVPTILISSGCAAQEFPEDRRAPIRLRGPVSLLALRVGIEHALRDRLVWRAA